MGVEDDEADVAEDRPVRLDAERRKRARVRRELPQVAPRRWSISKERAHRDQREACLVHDVTVIDVVDELCVPLAERLWQAYRGDVDGPNLIFADRRGGLRRVSEQESRVLMCGLLEQAGKFYSIETPTVEAYQQSGKYALSARSDLTVHGSRSNADRVLNVEFKSGAPTIEQVRKDLEKLARERIPGLWFHTLERSNRLSIARLAAKFRAAWALAGDHGTAADHDIVFAICGLNPEVLFTYRLRLGADTATSVESAFVGALDEWTRVGAGAAEWLSRSKPAIRTAKTRSRDRTGYEQWLISCADIAGGRLLHFNRQGQRYKLRDFTHVDAGGKVRPFHAPDPSSKRLITGTDEFIAAYAPAMVKNVRDEQLPMAQVARWQDVIARAADVRR